MTFRKISKVAIPVVLATIPFLALAVLPQPTNPLGGNALSLAEIQVIIERVARFLITVSIVVAVIFIVWGAIVWMTSAGDDARAKAGKAWIKNGLLGAVIVFAVGVILQTIAGAVTRTFFG